jgi:hypothetical protein
MMCGDAGIERINEQGVILDEFGSMERRRTAFTELLWENRKVRNENELSCTYSKSEDR